MSRIVIDTGAKPPREFTLAAGKEKLGGEGERGEVDSRNLI